MSLRSNLSSTTESDISGVKATVALLYRLPLSIVCVTLGLIGGAAGVALASLLVALFQGGLYRTSPFTLGVTLFTIIAVSLGLTVSWLLTQVTSRFFHNLFAKFDQRDLQVILVISIFTSLLQSVLFGVR